MGEGQVGFHRIAAGAQGLAVELDADVFLDRAAANRVDAGLLEVHLGAVAGGDAQTVQLVGFVDADGAALTAHRQVVHVGVHGVAGADAAAGVQRGAAAADGTAVGDNGVVRVQRGVAGGDGAGLLQVVTGHGQFGGGGDLALVNHGGHHGAGFTAGEQHMAGLDFTVRTVLDAARGAGQIRVGDREGDQAVAGQVDVVGAVVGQRHAAHVGDDVAGVFHVRGNQIDEAAVAHLDLALVGNRGVVHQLAAEIELAVHEILVGDVEGGGQQTGHIHFRPGAEHDAVGVDQEDVAVGGERAFDLRHGIAGDPVERDVAIVLMDELDQLPGIDAEVVPVDHRLAGQLFNDGLKFARRDGGVAGDHLAAAGSGLHRAAQPA